MCLISVLNDIGESNLEYGIGIGLVFLQKQFIFLTDSGSLYDLLHSKGLPCV